MVNPTSSNDMINDVLRAPLTRRNIFKLAAAASAAGFTASAMSLPILVDAQEGTPGGTATLIIGGNPASWDMTKTTWTTWQGIHHMYDRLLTFDAEENIQPGLATEWSISEDGLVYTLKLREGVTFHDGTPFNADSVVTNIQYHLDRPDSAFYTTYEPVTSVEAVDESTVQITLSGVRPNFIYEGLASWGAIQMSPTALGELGDRFGEAPVGTGPFKFESYEPGSSIRFVRNDQYWNGAPLLDAIEVRIITEPSVQVIEMEAGTADTSQVLAQDVQTLEGTDLIIESTIAPGAQFISLNVSHAPTEEFAVRRAIALATDRDSMIEALLFGYAEKSRAGVTSNSIFYNEDVPMVEYNPEEAGRILDEAGWVMGDDGVRQRDGQPLFVNILSTDYSNYGLFNQAIQEQLRAIGIDSEITSLEWNAYLDQWRENQGGWNVTFHSQGSIFAATAAMQASWVPNDYWTITQIDDATTPELQAVAEQLQSINDQFDQELDLEVRKELAKQAQMLYYENQLTVWLWHTAAIYAINPRLKDYRLTQGGRVVELDKAWIEE